MRRTPNIQDHLVPYLLGFAELWAMAMVGEAEGIWFLAMSAFAVVGIIALVSNLTHCTEDIFVECTWLRPLAVSNLYTAIALVAAGTILFFVMWKLHPLIPQTSPGRWQIAGYLILYVLQIAILVVTTIFVRGVRQQFDQEPTQSE